MYTFLAIINFFCCYFYTDKNWPLNYHLVFDLLVVGAIATFLLILLLPRSVEHKIKSTTGTSHPEVTMDNNTLEHPEVTMDNNTLEHETSVELEVLFHEHNEKKSL